MNNLPSRLLPKKFCQTTCECVEILYTHNSSAQTQILKFLRKEPVLNRFFFCLLFFMVLFRVYLLKTFKNSIQTQNIIFYLILYKYTCPIQTFDNIFFAAIFVNILTFDRF